MLKARRRPRERERRLEEGHEDEGEDDKDHHQHRLDVWFAKHFNAVHLREDASQAAARIVREATLSAIDLSLHRW